jgi:hypothetical protein
MAANIGEIRAGIIGTDGKHGRIQDINNALTIAPDLTCDVDRAILSAKEQYEKLRPREVTLKIAGNNGFDYAITALTGFVDGGSSILAVQYPFLLTDQVPAPLPSEWYALYRTDLGLFLRFLVHQPLASEFFLVTFTAQHTVNSTTCTIPVADEEAFKDLAAANCCDMLAALYAKDVDSSISADAVDRRTKSDTYRSMAARYRSFWDAKMQTGSAGAAAVSMSDVDRPGFGHRGMIDYFTHGSRTH